MLILAASCYLAGVAIGLRFDIRSIITMTFLLLIGVFVSSLTGWAAPLGSVFAALTAVIALQTGYVSIVILDAMGMVHTTEAAMAVRVRQPSASDSPSRR